MYKRQDGGSVTVDTENKIRRALGGKGYQIEKQDGTVVDSQTSVSYTHLDVYKRQILNGDIQKAPTKKIPYFNIEVPTELPGVDTNILDPRDTYADAAEWEEKAKDLAGRFIKNFAKYESNEAGKALVSAGPQLSLIHIS